MWYKKAKVIIDIIITVGVILSMFTGAISAFFFVMIAYTIPNETMFSFFIIIAISSFLIIALGGSGLTIIGVMGYGLLAEIAENTDEIKKYIIQTQQQNKSQEEYQRYKYQPH